MAIKNYSDHIILVETPSEPHIREELDKVMELVCTGTGFDVVIDLSNVDIVNSLSLSGFLQLRKLLGQSGNRLVFCSAAPVTKDIFRVTCFDGIFEFIDDRSKALESLQLMQRADQGP